MTLFTTTIASVLIRIEFIRVLLEAFLFLKNLLNFLDNRLMFSFSLSLESGCNLLALSAILLLCLSSLSWTTSL